MSVFDVSLDVVPLLDQNVTVNGSRNDALWCTGGTWGTGAGSCSANFSLPQALFDDYRDNLSERKVVVYVLNTYDGAAPPAPDFIGNLDVDSAQLGTDDTVTMTAHGMSSYLSKVWVGQAQKLPVVEYKLIDVTTGKKTNMTPERILRDVFSKMPTYYKARIRLGDTRVLATTEQTNTPSLTFRNCTVASAIDDVLSMFGDVTYTERYGSDGITYLDFFRIQDPAAPAVEVRVADFQDPVLSRANLETISHTKTAQDAVTRCIFYGTARKYIVSCNNYDVNLERILVKGWDTTLEAAVIANPKGAKPGAPGYRPGMEYVFRRWYLPSCFAGLLKRKGLGVHRTALATGQEGPEYHVQVWKFPTTLAFADGVHTGTESATRAILKNCKVDLDKGYFELDSAEDGLNATSMTATSSTGAPNWTWAPAKVGITFCVEDAQNFVYADTGQDGSSGIQLDFATDGLTEQLQRDDMTYVQFTNASYPIISPTGASLTFPSVLYNEDTGSWLTYATKTVVKDDTATLRLLANETLRAKNRRHHTWQGTVFYFARAYKPGNLLYVYGCDNPPPPLMITSVNWSIDDQQTQISADNVKPPLRKVVKGWHKDQA